MQTSLFDQVSDEHFELPDADLRLINNFLPDHQHWYQQLSASVDWRQDVISFKGKQQRVPRLTAWFGDAGADYSYSGIRLKTEIWSDPLLILKRKVEECAGHSFNSVLLNWYRDGQDSVAWHSDDEPELGRDPVIASLSLGTSREFQLRHNRRVCPSKKLDLKGGSLLIMAGAMQANWQHCVPKCQSVRGGRINLTFRFVYNI